MESFELDPFEATCLCNNLFILFLDRQKKERKQILDNQNIIGFYIPLVFKILILIFYSSSCIIIE